jgi:hypothetical protein
VYLIEYVDKILNTVGMGCLRRDSGKIAAGVGAAGRDDLWAAFRRIARPGMNWSVPAMKKPQRAFGES